MILIPNQTIFWISNFVMGFTVTLKCIIAYTHLLEWVPGYESMITGVLFGYDGAVALVCPLILLYITKDT